MAIRALASRSPYTRGGVYFDARVAQYVDGRAMVVIDDKVLASIGRDGLRQLVEDPNIELQGSMREPKKANPSSKVRGK